MDNKQGSISHIKSLERFLATANLSDRQKEELIAKQKAAPDDRSILQEASNLSRTLQRKAGNQLHTK